MSDLCAKIEAGEKLSIDKFNTMLEATRSMVEALGEKSDADR